MNADHPKRMMIFDMDNTVLQQSFIHTAARHFNFREQLAAIAAENLADVPRTRKIATLLKGKTYREMIDVATGIPVVEDAAEVMQLLKDRGYTIGIISDSYDCVTAYLRDKLGMHFSCSNELLFSNGVATGEVIIPRAFLHQASSSCTHAYCKTNMMRHVMATYGFTISQVTAVGDGPNDVCMIRHAAQGVAFNAQTEHLKEVASLVLDERSFRPLLSI